MHLGIAITRRRLAAGVAITLAAGLTSVTVARALDQGPPAPHGCDRARLEAAERRDLDTGPVAHGAGRASSERVPEVVVIGDSWSVGVGVDPLETWPVRLPGRVHVDGFSGSGFSAGAIGCHRASYADRAARAVAGRPDALVVVEGGLNDHDQPDREIERGFVAMMRELAGHRVVVVGPAPAPARAAQVPRVDAALARMATGFGASYVSMAEVEVDYLDDAVHPTVGGHREFGDLVAAAVRDELS